MTKRKIKEHLIKREWCKGCGICVAFCAKRVLELDDYDKAFPLRPNECVVCRLCEMRCPDLAIEIIAEDAAE